MNTKDPFYAGLDMGSVSVKAVITRNDKWIADGLRPVGGTFGTTARAVMETALSRAGIGFADLSGLVITGLGSGQSPYEGRQVSDISCHAKGCHTLFPETRTLIDIGGQFSKAARLTNKGGVADFLMSEKCATGSGRFLQVISRILQVPVEAIGPLSLESRHPVEFSTNCAVFSESETVSRIAEGAKPADILAGVHKAMAAKIRMLAKRVRLSPDVVITGGGGRDEGLVKAIGTALDQTVRVPRHPRLTAAFGAACLARQPL